jgi:hypothetical protein
MRYHNATVATYQMDFGKWKIINLGIWGHESIKNAAFLNYFDKCDNANCIRFN